ncbi:WD-REPEATS-REGION domain-containing protein [Mycena sanguinolenta]|uniref:WD-REPEATS-REGION domain-containing protein n=1 Tax=Mycena sanguinolenta TaxID=230812 RepID=A0A8H7CQB3_9AGAR|nr:WD-REPEATS-REGION domain-containing protein [Mycena sanguinolenta]
MGACFSSRFTLDNLGEDRLHKDGRTVPDSNRQAIAETPHRELEAPRNELGSSFTLDNLEDGLHKDGGTVPDPNRQATAETPHEELEPSRDELGSQFTHDNLEEDGLHKDGGTVPDSNSQVSTDSETPHRELEFSTNDELGRSTTAHFYGNISGGTGGLGGEGGATGGSGGRGEGPRFTARKQIFLACPPDPSVRLVLCSGPAGSGKSTIAKTVAARLEEEKKLLAASFFFSRDYAERKEIKYLSSTLAHQLADYNPKFRDLLVTLLKDDHSRLVHADPKEQFQKMVVELLAKMPPSQTPWVICLDALDECGKDHGKILLYWLSDAISNIPVHIWFFLTGRPEICHSLTFNLSGLCRYNNIEAINSEIARKDIHFYVSHSLVDPTWDWKVTDRDVDEITSRANGLFIFAATAVRYVRMKSEHGSHPQKSVDGLLKNNAHIISVHALYLQIIEELIGIPIDNDAFERSKKVLSAIVDLVEPQDIKTLARLLDIEIGEFQWALVRLSAVWHVPDHVNEGVIKIIHLSFREFLTSRTGGIGGDYPGPLCSTEAQQHDLVHNTFRVMQKELKFNICHLPTSHVRNINIADLEECKKKYIPGHLVYSARFWGSHLAVSHTGGNNLRIQVGMRSTHPIYVMGSWLSKALKGTKAAFWIVSGSEDNTVRVWDAESGDVVAGPFNGHIDEVTSVAFSPNGKQVVSGSRATTVCVWDRESGEVVAGPFNGHTHWVNSVSFSPDNKQIVSGSGDGTVQVWDAESGEVVAGPFSGHTDSVTSVAFSPDGKQIVSGSWDKTIAFSLDGKQIVSGSGAMIIKNVAGPFRGYELTRSATLSPDGKQVISGSQDNTVCVWDVGSGKVVAGPFTGHTDSVTSVSFSPDGKQVVSSSWDKTVCVWDVGSGEVVAGPFNGHTSSVSSVAFSPDGKKIVSASDDKTVRIWDVASGGVGGGPSNGHTSSVSSVAFSPDGKKIVSGSDDKTMQVWDAESGKVVTGPFTGHTDSVTSVSFSPDGKWIVSGSSDNTVHVWDVENGAVVGGPFNSHTKRVTSVAFSPDGKQVISGSWDKTVHVLDVGSGDVVAGLFNGHAGSVNSVAFSPDGKWIVSGSSDKTVCVWDAESGEIVAGPFNGHTNLVYSVAFSPDGKQIVSGSWDNTVTVWDAESGEVHQQILGPVCTAT